MITARPPFNTTCNSLLSTSTVAGMSSTHPLRRPTARAPSRSSRFFRRPTATTVRATATLQFAAAVPWRFSAAGALPARLRYLWIDPVGALPARRLGRSRATVRAARRPRVRQPGGPWTCRLPGPAHRLASRFPAAIGRILPRGLWITGTLPSALSAEPLQPLALPFQDGRLLLPVTAIRRPDLAHRRRGAPAGRGGPTASTPATKDTQACSPGLDGPRRDRDRRQPRHRRREPPRRTLAHAGVPPFALARARDGRPASKASAAEITDAGGSALSRATEHRRPRPRSRGWCPTPSRPSGRPRTSPSTTAGRREVTRPTPPCPRSPWTTSTARWRSNLRGTFLCLKYELAAMLENPGGPRSGSDRST